ncbi:MAG: hypothetical protein EXR52_07070 [Dehalococcoidia bacterium]|nr:hypothetical protein [Dehalococcoidia bacterium]
MEWIFPALAVGIIILVFKLMRSDGLPPLDDEQKRAAELDSGAWNAAMTAGVIIGAASLSDHSGGIGGDTGGGGA